MVYDIWVNCRFTYS